MTEMTYDFTLTKMTVIDGEPNSEGNRLLASFETLVMGIRLRGLLLIQKGDGQIACSGSNGKTRRGHLVSMHIEDPELRCAIIGRAAKLYEGFTGRQVTSLED